MENNIIKSIISTDYSDVESQAHVNEILSDSMFSDNDYDRVAYDKEGFTTALDFYLKKRHEDYRKNNTCMCISNPIYRSQAKIFFYKHCDKNIEKHLCERCGYVFFERENRQYTTY
jgi:hypothetical protein